MWAYLKTMRNWTIKWYAVFYLLILWFDGLCCNGEEEEVAVTAPMKKTEQEALYSAIQGFVGDWWNGSDLYPDPCGWTPIQGVSCDLVDGFWYVRDLNIGSLYDNSLTCSENPEFRPQIFELNHLKSLSFFKCFTSNNLVTLPTDNWGKLSASLETLEFRSNPSLIGPIPTIFCNLQNLQSLVLIENGFTGELPKNIGNISHLQRLVLSGNGLKGRVPDSLGNLTELLILDLSRNSLSGYIPPSIGYLESLLKLDLSNNMLVGTVPRAIGNLKNLTLLDLRNNIFSGGLTRALEEMTSLQELALSSNPIGGNINDVDWQKMQNLMILDLANLSLAGEIPESLAKLKNLRYVGLSNNNLRGNLPHELASMPCVSAIYVNGNNLTGELKFPEGLYGKLGRRFRAWSNPNLCYTGLMSTRYIPLGVKPCKSNEIFNDPVLNFGLGDKYGNLDQQDVQKQSSVNPDQAGVLEGYGNPNLDFISSLGSSSSEFHGIWWVFLVEICMMVLVRNCFFTGGLKELVALG